jgi:hypothetical protein
MILLISASQVARITGVSHQHPAKMYISESVKYGSVRSLKPFAYDARRKVVT